MSKVKKNRVIFRRGGGGGNGTPPGPVKPIDFRGFFRPQDFLRVNDYTLF